MFLPSPCHHWLIGHRAATPDPIYPEGSLTNLPAQMASYLYVTSLLWSLASVIKFGLSETCGIHMSRHEE